MSVDAWQRTGVALDLPLEVAFRRDPTAQPADAGHLALQELILRLAARNGISLSFELPTRPQDPACSVDVCLRDDQRRRLVLCEAWNVIGDIGAAVRSTHRKIAQAQEFTMAIDRAYAVHACWVVRASRRNRALVTRYPEVFAAAFPGSSLRWVSSLTSGADPPQLPGLVWADAASTRLFPWRRVQGQAALAPFPAGRAPSADRRQLSIAGETRRPGC